MYRHRLLQGGYASFVSKVLSYAPTVYWRMAEPSGTVALDSSGHGRHAAYKASGQPLLGQSGPYIDTAALFDGADDYVNAAAVAPYFNGDQGSFLFWFQMDDADLAAATGRRLVYWQVDVSNRIVIEKTANPYELAATTIFGGTARGITTTITDAGFNLVGFTYDRTGKNKQRLYVAGITSNEMGSLGTFAGTLGATTTLLGAATTGGANPFKGKLAEFAYWDRALTQYDMGDIAHFRGGRRIIFLGDSRTVGGTNGAIPYPRQFLSMTDGYRPANLGVGGLKASDILNSFDTDVAPYCAGAVVVVWAGLNDVTGGASTATTYATLKQIWTKIRTAGGSPIACTEIDSQGASANAVSWHTSARADLSTKIASDPTQYDDLADLGADARLLDATDGTYFQTTDLIHLTTTGQGVVASIIGPKAL